MMMTKPAKRQPSCNAVSCCANLNIPFFVDAGNKKLVFWFVRTDDYGHTEIARCTGREFSSLTSHLQAGARYCPDCGTVHYPDDEDIHA